MVLDKRIELEAVRDDNMDEYLAEGELEQYPDDASSILIIDDETQADTNN